MYIKKRVFFLVIYLISSFFLLSYAQGSILWIAFMEGNSFIYLSNWSTPNVIDSCERWSTSHSFISLTQPMHSVFFNSLTLAFSSPSFLLLRLGREGSTALPRFISCPSTSIIRVSSSRRRHQRAVYLTRRTEEVSSIHVNLQHVSL